MRVYLYILFLFFFLCPSTSLGKEDPLVQQAQNLIAFTKAYGYIRYFHPVDESKQINWDKFLLYGIPKIVGCKSNNELRDSLLNLFNPISTLVSFHIKKTKRPTKLPYTLADTLVFHQYRGINTSHISYLQFRDYQTKICNNTFIDSSLFRCIPNYKESYCTQLIPGLFIDFPLVSKIEHHKNYTEQLYEKMSGACYHEINEKQLKSSVDIAYFWNIIQHFYPYHSESRMNWGQTLESVFMKVLKDSLSNNSAKYIFMLGKEMKDGHFRIVNYFRQGFYLPIKVRLLNSVPVVTESYDTILFKKGDVLQTIDHKPVSILIDSMKSYISGSDEFINYWCSNLIHKRERPSEITTNLLRDDNISIRAKCDFFKFQSKSKFLEKGIYYCNLADDNCDMDTIINIASKTNAIILDWRDGSGLINVHKLFQHLIDDTLGPPFKFMIPQVVYPDHKFDTYYEPKQFLNPLKPRIRTKVIILCSPSNISYQESIIKMAQLNYLATIIGETTGGANGSINYTKLPSGLEIVWTGMKVVNLDGLQFHLKGVKPNIPVMPKLAGISAGKDEILDRALEFLKKYQNE